jgi:hypothetical protein
MIEKITMRALGLQELYNNEVSSEPDVNLKLSQDTAYKPDIKDLESLADICCNTLRTTVLEFGVGWSSLVFSKCLQANENEIGSLHNYRRNNPYEVHSVDTSKKYISIAQERIKDLSNIYFHHSECFMTEFNGRISTQYENLPLVSPDLIYIDAPHQFEAKGEVNGWSTRHNDMMPMICDVLKIEHFLTPKTIIVIDGRAANARFIKSNLQRDWDYKYCKDRDQHFFVLEEEPLGKYSQSIIQDVYYKKGFWNVSSL